MHVLSYFCWSTKDYPSHRRMGTGTGFWCGLKPHPWKITNDCCILLREWSRNNQLNFTHIYKLHNLRISSIMFYFSLVPLLKIRQKLEMDKQFFMKSWGPGWVVPTVSECLAWNHWSSQSGDVLKHHQPPRNEMWVFWFQHIRIRFLSKWNWARGFHT